MYRRQTRGQRTGRRAVEIACVTWSRLPARDVNGLYSPVTSKVVLSCLPGFERSWPILLQETRQGAIGEQPPPGLATRAIVRLVRGVSNALHCCPTHGARLAVAAMDRHPFPERRHLLRKRVTGLRLQPLDPLGEGVAGGAVQPRRFLLTELRREFERGESCGMEDLVGIRVSDSVEQSRIGEGSLQGVRLARDCFPKLLRARVPDVEAARVVPGEFRGTVDEVERRAVLCAGLGEEQGARREIERGEADLAG